MSGRFGELLVILIIILVLFGAGRVPRIMNDIAKGIKAFKDGFKDDDKSNDKGNE
jgi:sec-independent protein translocase protein TatA